MTFYEIESDKDCDSNVDYITEIKKRLDFIESILKIKVKKVKKTKTIRMVMREQNEHENERN